MSVLDLSRIRAALSASAVTRSRAARPARLDVDAQRLADFLRRRHPRDTAAHVAAETGIALRTVANWLTGSVAAPTFAHAMRLVAAYGPSLVMACVEPVPGWAREAAASERRRAIAAEIDRLTHELDQIGGAA